MHEKYSIFYITPILLSIFHLIESNQICSQMFIMTSNQRKYDGWSEKKNEDGSRVKHAIKAKANATTVRQMDRHGQKREVENE